MIFPQLLLSLAFSSNRSKDYGIGAFLSAIGSCEDYYKQTAGANFNGITKIADNNNGQIPGDRMLSHMGTMLNNQNRDKARKSLAYLDEAIRQFEVICHAYKVDTMVEAEFGYYTNTVKANAEFFDLKNLDDAVSMAMKSVEGYEAAVVSYEHVVKSMKDLK